MDNLELLAMRELTETELTMIAGGGIWKALQDAAVSLSATFGGFVGYLACGGPCAAGGALGGGAAAQNMLNNPSSIPPVLAM